MTPFRPPEVIETDDLLLRRPELSDAQALFDEMLGDRDTMSQLPTPRHTRVEDTLAFIEKTALGWQNGSLIHWVLEDKATGRLTAMIELRPNPPRVEFGVIISRQGGARRRRAGLYALRKLIDWLIAQPSIFRIDACCPVDGVAHRAMERLGFTLEGKLVNYSCLPNLGLAAADNYLYALTRPVPPKTVHPVAAWLAEHTV